MVLNFPQTFRSLLNERLTQVGLSMVSPTVDGSFWNEAFSFDKLCIRLMTINFEGHLDRLVPWQGSQILVVTI